MPSDDAGYCYGNRYDQSDDIEGELLTAIWSQKNIALVKKTIDIVSKKMKTSQHIKSD